MVFVYNCPAKKKVFLRLKKLQQRWKFFISCIMVFLIRKSTWLISGSSQNAYRMSSSKSREKSFEPFFPLDSAHICFVLFVMIYDLTEQIEYNLHEFVKQNVYIVLRWNFFTNSKTVRPYQALRGNSIEFLHLGNKKVKTIFFQIFYIKS